MNLSTLTPQQRLIGAILSLVLWILPALGVWLYMASKVDAAHELGQAEAKAECAERQTDALAKAIKEARAEWEKTQEAIDKKAERDTKAIAAELAATQRKLTNLSRDIRTYVDSRPLPPDCRADPERIRLWNDARRGHAPEG